MDSKFQSSFIPKTPIVGPAYTYRPEKTSLFGKLASAFFVVTLLGVGGLFLYKKMSESSLESLKTDLATAESAVDKAGIHELSSFDKKLRAAKDVVFNHISFSEYLDFLEDSTLASISYSSLSYTAPSGQGPITVALSGYAPSYAAIAQAEKVLLSNPNVVSVGFDGFKLSEKGGVSFTLNAELKRDVVKWSNTVKGMAPTATTKTATSTKTASTTDDLDTSDFESIDLPDDLPNF